MATTLSTSAATLASLTSTIGDFLNYPYNNTAIPIQSPIVGPVYTGGSGGNGGNGGNGGSGGGSYIIGGSSIGSILHPNGGPMGGVSNIPAQPKNMTIPNIVNGEKFEECLEIFVCNFDVTDEIMRFHYSVWVKNFGELMPDYGTVTRQFSYEKAIINDHGFIERNRTFAAFGSQLTKEHFLSWLENYRTVFYTNVFMEDTFVPELDSTRKVSGIFVIDNVEKNVTYQARKDYVLDSWAWVVSHCYNPVVRVSDIGWLFSNDAEAIHFKMRD